jgi:Zn-dependent M28 family amino/carboxypeptidase
MSKLARALGRHARGLAIVALALAAMVPAGGAIAAPSQADCDARANVTPQMIIECIRVGQVRAHQAALQEIADDNGGTREAGTPGYTASVEYVVDTLEAAGWNVELDEFPFTFIPPPTLQQLTPIAATYETGAFTGSGSGEVTGSVIPVDINLTPPRASTSGCEASDFSGLDFSGENDIALIQRGTCTFGLKALNAQTAGAEAVIIFNQGNDPTREGLIVGTLLPDGAAVTIPVVGASFADGAALAQAGSTASVEVPPAESRPQVNVIAERTGANDENVVMAGAHLDSVRAGPGINDNGSGSAVLLEVAQQLAHVRLQNTVRLAWWGAEEAGLIGSTAYVDGLSQAEKDRIALYMNFDMVGSPNYIFMTQDADESSFDAPVAVPPGSVAIEDLFESFYTKQNEPYDDAAFDGRSDYQAFIADGIPAGGLFTGAEVLKTAEQQAIWGGTVGAQFDPCYHLACDTFANNNNHALDVNADSIGFATLWFSYSTQSVNGVPGMRVPGNFTLPAPAGTQGTCPVNPPLPSTCP